MTKIGRGLGWGTTRLVLARELWARDHGTYDYSAWDDDALLTTTYEKYIAKAEKAIRDEMARAQ